MTARKPEEVQSLFTTAFNAGRIEDLVALYEDEAVNGQLEVRGFGQVEVRTLAPSVPAC